MNNDFKPFAIGVNANVLTQADYEKQLALAGGFTAGIAKSAEINKVLRQSSVIAAALAQTIADKTAQDIRDDGDMPALQQQLSLALQLSQAGLSQINLSNSDVTLSQAQYASPVLVLTGNLTADVKLIFPVVERSWLLINRATGAHVVSCKVAGGASIPIANSGDAFMVCDGSALQTLSGNAEVALSVGPATETAHAVNLAAMQHALAAFMPLKGGTFTGAVSVIPAEKKDQPVQLEQLQTNYMPLIGGDFAGAITIQAAQQAESPVQLRQMQEAISHSIGVPVGSMVASMASIAPDGFLHCNGAEVSRTAYSALFAAIGTTAGAGDGSTSFNVPDLRGVVPRGLDDGRGFDAGRILGSFQNDAISAAQLTGMMTDPGHSHGIPGRGADGGGGGAKAVNADTTICNTRGATTDITFKQTQPGTDETRMKNLAVNFFIKY